MPRLTATTRGRKSLPAPPTLPLDPGSTAPIDMVVDVVSNAWGLAVHSGAMSEQTRDKLILLTRRFESFASAHGVTSASEIDHDLVLRFVTAQGRTKRGEITSSAAATMRNRRSAIRAVYRTARQAGLFLDDPTDDIKLPQRDPSTHRPVAADEAAMIRLLSQRAQPTRHAATAALLLAGAHTAELGHITADDVDVDAQKFRAHGSSKHRPRVLPIDSWSTNVLKDRINYLRRPRSGPPAICTSAGGSNAHKQARVCMTVREIITRAGLSGDPGIRPSSLTAYAARQVFDRTGLVEAAAIVLGASSLDTTAALIGYQWR